MIFHSQITCPECGFQHLAAIPEENAAWHVVTCPGCEARLSAKVGECCVFCVYGDVPCFPEQISVSSCCGANE